MFTGRGVTAVGHIGLRSVFGAVISPKLFVEAIPHGVLALVAQHVVDVGGLHGRPCMKTSIPRRSSASASASAPSWPALSACAKIVTHSMYPGSASTRAGMRPAAPAARAPSPVV